MRANGKAWSMFFEAAVLWGIWAGRNEDDLLEKKMDVTV
jgi:hypothetical protein